MAKEIKKASKKRKKDSVEEEFIKKTFLAKAKENCLDQDDAWQSFEDPKHTCVDSSLLYITVIETLEVVEEEYKKYHIKAGEAFDRIPSFKSIVANIQEQIRSVKENSMRK